MFFYCYVVVGEVGFCDVGDIVVVVVVFWLVGVVWG